MGKRTTVIDKLLENASDVHHHNNFNEKTPLQLAARRGDIAIVCRLLENGAKISDINEGIIDAAKSGNLKLVELLVSHGVDINYSESVQKNTALLAAIKSHKLKVAEYLVEQGADVNALDSNGNSSLLLMANMKRRRWYQFW